MTYLVSILKEFISEYRKKNWETSSPKVFINKIYVKISFSDSHLSWVFNICIVYLGAES